MKTMMLCQAALAVALSIAVPATAQPAADATWEFLMARAAADEQRYDEAIERMNRVVAANPSDPVLLYERAMIFLDAGQVERAEAELRTVAAKNPDFYDANRVLGRILLDRASPSDRARVDEALGYLQAAWKANPEDLATGMTISQILGGTDRMEEAGVVLASMVERFPDQRAINFAYAQVLTKLGRGSESRKYLERVVAIDPTFPPAIMQLIEIYQGSNEWRKAAEVLEPLVLDDNVNLELRRQQAYFFLRSGDAEAARSRFDALVRADPADARSRYYLAEALNDLQRYADAEAIFRQLLDASPNDADLMASLGLSLAGQEKWEDAATTFNVVLGLPNTPENLGALARTQLAYIDLRKGNFSAAFATASAIAVFRDKPNAQAINIALDALRRQEKPADAVAFLTPIAAKFGTDPFVNARYIEALVRAGDKAEAKAVAAGQVKLGTRNLIAVAEAYVQAGDTATAIGFVAPAVAARPEEIDLQFELGSLHERAGDDAKAAEVFLAILERHPEHAPTLNYLGYMWAENGVNLERAHEMLTRAVGQEPNNGAYVDSLGWVYFRLGNLEQAEKYLTDAARLAPRDATVAEHLGDVLAKRGEMERALAQYRTALTLDPESKDVDKIRSKIAELEGKGQPPAR